MKIIGVIPARYASDRFPGRPLLRLVKFPVSQLKNAEKPEQPHPLFNGFIAAAQRHIHHKPL